MGGAHGIDGVRVQPRLHIGLFDQRERHHGTGEYDGVQLSEVGGDGVDDGFDGARIGHVELVCRSAEPIGQLRQAVHPPCGEGHRRAPGMGGMCQRLSDAGRCPDDQHPRPRDVGVPVAHTLLPSRDFMIDGCADATPILACENCHSRSGYRPGSAKACLRRTKTHILDGLDPGG